MKRFLFPFCIIIFLALVALIPIRQTYNLSINSSYFNVYQNLVTAENWIKWNDDFRNTVGNLVRTSSDGFIIKNKLSNLVFKKKGLGAFKLTLTQGLDISRYEGVVTIGDKMGITKLYVRRQTNLYSYIRGLIAGKKKQAIGYQLKNYLEDTLQFYGFIINEQLLSEDLMIVMRQKSSNNKICQNNRTTLKSLIILSKKGSLKITGPVRLQYIASTPDSTDIMVGLPIAKRKNPFPGIQCMAAPSGKMLVGYFKGKYKDRQMLYNAMSTYLSDHYLHPQTKPFEKFENNLLPADEESSASFQVIIPFV